ncbi:Diaminopimelate epimerase,diaminopimelate epimerase,Diaminopimelate epimerase,diaminopimelate epimerase,Diaminopimelate epimerase [Chlamydia serpentis]|uniref:Diaminopimelate epimerase n=1 Tax=Chlamydia serpentis TaxID=1967782 RepID=A0A2R8FB40_9CHLA|nr:bifunctional diaminopimelate epimerase/glutamate racemase [Chlamydia serpentis]SPN73638.1 Diaminopimelate epimerase,diaminopimelate epimerase,Diaminopimelate epimerase,diaminopimelate epimerase,Diaminopimelate epimerase [Chlamydia serpentis]
MGFYSPSTISNYFLYSGAGNRFLLSEKVPATKELKLLCEETQVDGFLFLKPSSCADARLIIFNSDGSRPTMCGNGLRCVIAHLAVDIGKSEISIETDNGIYSGYFYSWNRVLVDMTLSDWQFSIHELEWSPDPLPEEVFFINTGVPHVVAFVPELGNLDLARLGPFLRNHQIFSPQGVNVNFVQVIGHCELRVRTYERGVERETAACGTGVLASALVASKCYGWNSSVYIRTWGEASMTVSKSKDRVYLEGPVRRNLQVV